MKFRSNEEFDDVKTDDSVFSFVSWNHDKYTVEDSDITFIGTWKKVSIETAEPETANKQEEEQPTDRQGKYRVRFHFIDNGTPLENHFIKGSYYSVNPIATEKIPKLFCQNKREWSLFKSENFGDIIHVEVGATCVGSIIQTYNANSKVYKGDEKGYFKFGGSTTILFFKKDTIEIDEDILKESSKGIECKVSFGETIGHTI